MPISAESFSSLPFLSTGISSRAARGHQQPSLPALREWDVGARPLSPRSSFFSLRSCFAAGFPLTDGLRRCETLLGGVRQLFLRRVSPLGAPWRRDASSQSLLFSVFSLFFLFCPGAAYRPLFGRRRRGAAVVQ